MNKIIVTHANILRVFHAILEPVNCRPWKFGVFYQRLGEGYYSHRWVIWELERLEQMRRWNAAKKRRFQ